MMVQDNDGTFTLAAIQDPCALLSGHDGPLRLHLDRASTNGRIVLCLSSDKADLLSIRLDKLLKFKKKTSCCVDVDRSKKRSKKKRKRRKKNKNKVNQDQVDRYDWTEHELDLALKELETTKVSGGTNENHEKRKQRRRRKKRKRKKRDKKRNKEKRKKSKRKRKARRKQKRRENGQSRRSDCCEMKSPVIGSNSWTSRSQDEVTPSSSAKSTPKCFNTDPARILDRSPSPSNSPVLSMSDLRSPLAWEKRRQAILYQSKPPGTARISALSLTNPFQTVNGFFLTSGGTSQTKLDETLKGGAFVYKSPRRESKMIKWQKRLTGSKSLISCPFDDPDSDTPSSPSTGSSQSLQDGPSSHPQLEMKHEEEDCKLRCADGSSWLEFDPEVTVQRTASAGLFSGTYDSQRRMEENNPPYRLNTLHQIQELESYESSTGGVEDDLDDTSGNEGSAQHSKDRSQFQTSSFGSARVTGENDLWSYSTDEEERSWSWLDRLRDKWTRRRSRHY